MADLIERKDALNCLDNREQTNSEWLRGLPNEELVKFLNIDSVCHEITKESQMCPNCSCGECIVLWLKRKRGKA